MHTRERLAVSGSDVPTTADILIGCREDSRWFSVDRPTGFRRVGVRSGLSGWGGDFESCVGHGHAQILCSYDHDNGQDQCTGKFNKGRLGSVSRGPVAQKNIWLRFDPNV